MQYSVLMSVYQRENPEFLQQAIDSILSQTIKPDEFLIVWDGPLTLELENLLNNYQKQYSNTIRFLKLQTNVGLGEALRRGVEYCRYPLIARMDSDDIAVSRRMEWQLKAFQASPNLAVCGGQIAEFISNPNQIESKRVVPCKEQEIFAYAKKRNPMNHMTVMFQKAAVLKAGNYLPMHLAEDYYLWVRMLAQGYSFENLPQVLVKARVGNGMFQRRGGFRYIISIKQLMTAFYDLGFISLGQCLTNIVIRSLVSFMPAGLRQMIYQRRLRQ